MSRHPRWSASKRSRYDNTKVANQNRWRMIADKQGPSLIVMSTSALHLVQDIIGDQSAIGPHYQPDESG
jgi:hypothetical protein